MVDIWWEEVAGPGNGPVVVAVHGMSRTAASWPPELVAAIVGGRRRLVVVDLRGQGWSPWVDGDVAEFAADLNAVLDGVGTPVHLLGESLGAVVAQQVAIGAPAVVRSLSLVSTTGWYVDPTIAGSPEEVVAGRWLRDRKETPGELIRTVVRNELALAGTWPAVDEDAWTPAVEVWVERGYNPDDRHRETLVRMTPQYEALAGLSMPALVVHGDADLWVPVAHGEKVARCIAGARLEIVAGMGHGVAPGAGERLASLLVPFWEAVEAEGEPLKDFSE